MNEETTTSPIPDFDTIRQVNPYGMEYWSARDLMSMLGYSKWENFHIAINRAIKSCEQTGNVIADHFPESRKPITGGKGAVQHIKDYNLSRFACYLTAQNGEPSKPEIAAAQVYFAVAARKNEINQLLARQNQRIELRERITEGNKSLTQAAAQAGVSSKSFGKFHDSGYKGLYGDFGVEQVKARKKIGPKEDLMDRAGLSELGANALRIGQTDEKLRRDKVTGEADAIQTHHQVGKEIRAAIERLGNTLPEDLPTEASIKPLLDERKRKKKKTIQSNDQPKLLDEEV